MNKYALIAPTLVVAAAALHLMERRSHETELASVRAEVASLSGAMEGVRSASANGDRARRPLEITAAFPLPSPAPDKPVAKEGAPPDQQAARPDPKPRPPEVAEVRERLEATFAEERADPVWTRDAQSTAEAKLTSLIPDAASLRSVECRSSMCRIETVHQDQESYRKFVQSAFMNPESKLWNGGFFSTIAGEPEDGKLTIVSYLARDGEALPPVQNLQ